MEGVSIGKDSMQERTSVPVGIEGWVFVSLIQAMTVVMRLLFLLFLGVVATCSGSQRQLQTIPGGTMQY